MIQDKHTVHVFPSAEPTNQPTRTVTELDTARNEKECPSLNSQRFLGRKLCFTGRSGKGVSYHLNSEETILRYLKHQTV